MISVVTLFIGVILISFVVFGGAQMFIPYFKVLLVNFLGIDSNVWESALTIANATPGVFGLKLAFISGCLTANNQWWAFILMFLSYTFFVLIPIGMILLVSKKIKKTNANTFIQSFIKMMKPIIAGILLSVAINLFISISIPFIGFNDVSDDFISLDKYLYFKETFFNGWRYWILLTWSICSIPISFWILKKYKFNPIFLICINIIICLILFQPWIN